MHLIARCITADDGSIPAERMELLQHMLAEQFCNLREDCARLVETMVATAQEEPTTTTRGIAAAIRRG